MFGDADPNLDFAKLAVAKSRMALAKLLQSVQTTRPDGDAMLCDDLVQSLVERVTEERVVRTRVRELLRSPDNSLHANSKLGAYPRAL